MVLLGGRAAEDVLCQVPSIGATDDMQRATQIVMQQLMAFGMDKSRVGLLAFHPEETRRGRSFVHFSENMQQNAEDAAKRIVDDAYLRAKKMIQENKDKIDKMSSALVEKSEITKEEIEKIWGARPKTPTTAQWTDTLEKEVFA
jgi:ATP-dependent Zn protease